jgi:hypothetical protein
MTRVVPADDLVRLHAGSLAALRDRSEYESQRDPGARYGIGIARSVESLTPATRPAYDGTRARWTPGSGQPASTDTGQAWRSDRGG